jgi:hypothetical protein
VSASTGDGWDEALADLLAEEAPGGAAPADGARPAGGSAAGGRPGPAALGGAGPAGSAALGAADRAADGGEEPPEVAVLVFAVPDELLLAAFLKGPQIAAKTLSAGGMGFAVLDHPTEAEALEAARTASATLKGVPVFLMHRGPTANPAGADMQAYLYVDGEERQRVAPGLALAQSPQLLEDLLIDPEAAEDALAEAVDVTELTPADAIAIIGRSLSARADRRRWRKRKGQADAA